jgi:hypothetical protein
MPLAVELSETHTTRCWYSDKILQDE